MTVNDNVDNGSVKTGTLAVSGSTTLSGATTSTAIITTVELDTQTVFIGSGSFSITPIAVAADTNPVPLSKAEVAHIEATRAATAADPANQEVHVIAAEAPPRPNAETVTPEVTGSTLDANLRAAQTKGWKENGANPNILACYAAVGCPQSADTTAWCAAFAGTMLKMSGLPYKKSLSSLNYQGVGTPVPINDPTQWRKNDLVVFKRTGGGHVGFIQEVCPTQKKLSVLGGNQSDTLNITNFGPTYYGNIVWIGRCETGVTDNTSIVKNSLGATGSSKVT